jgi:hypothetical protein
MSSMRFNACLDTSHHGSPNPFRDAVVVADSLTSIHNAMVNCLFVVTGAAYTRDFRCHHRKNPEDSNLASVEAMQWALLYLPIGHDRCY